MSRTSLTRFLIEEQHAKRINADLRQLVAVVARACTSISIAVSKGALGGVLAMPAPATCRVRRRRSWT